ncbi:MAG: phosphodiester glycosidase family protein, partial [Solimonas sp.]
LNLDGGGSSSMVVNGSVVNVPSGGGERAVSDAIVLTR